MIFGKGILKYIPAAGVDCTRSYTVNEELVRIQNKCLVPIYVFPEIILCSLVISKIEL
jgi:hypothetical protein